MLKWTLLLSILFFHLYAIAQKPFVGSMEYDLVSVDMISKDTVQGKLFIYALDSLVRYTYLMSDGKKQESIHHLKRQKLLSLLELDGQFFAVQIQDTAKEIDPFKYLKTRSKKQIAGLKCREANVVSVKGNALLYYTKTIDARYFVGMNNAPGLPIKGQIPTDNGYMAFELQQLDKKTPPIQLFIPDKKYKVLTLEAFLEWTQSQNSSEPQD
jgi:hypothetical protein